MTEQVAVIAIGQTFVDVPHGSSSTPTVDDIAIMPHDNLGGRSWWIGTIGAVNFRLNISSADGGFAHEFGWRLLSETYEPAVGRYGILVAEQQTKVLRRNEAEAKGSIIGFSFWMLKQGYSKATIQGRIKLLNRLMRLGADFNNEDSIKEIISQQTWSVSRKVNAVDAYDSLLKMQGKTWTPPIYRRVRKLPFIPTEAEIDQLIAGCSKRIATFLQLLKETGMRCGEACDLLKWTDIDLEQRSVRITPEKGSNPRILPLSVKLVDMLAEMPRDTPTVFSVNADMMRHNFEHQRKRIGAKLKNSRINQITFHTFRHWKATMEYRKTRDILHVKEILGHKSLNNTMLYTQLISFKDDDFTAAVAHSEEEACKLIEAGFEYVCEFSQNKIFRKRK